MRIAFRFLPLITAALALGTSSATSQSVVKRLGDDFGNVGKDILGVWASPLHAGTRDWIGVAEVVGMAGIISIADDNVDRWAVQHGNASEFSALKELRRGGLVYAGHTFVPYVGATYLVGVAINNRNLRDGVMGCGASYVSQTLPRQVVYRTIARTRPAAAKDADSVRAAPPAQQGDQYDFSVFKSVDWTRRSMPGGHVSNVMSCAAFLSERFHLGPIEPALYAVVAGVGVGRLLDRGHWSSDQFLGSVLGYAVGRTVAKRSLARAHGSGSSSSDGSDGGGMEFSIVPMGDHTSLRWTRVF